MTPSTRRRAAITLASTVLASSAAIGSATLADALPTESWAARPAAPRPALAGVPLVVVGLGDSVPAAAACPGCTGFVTQVGARIAGRQQRPLVLTNAARGGETSTSVFTRLDSPAVKAAVTASDLVIIQVGANDFTEANASRAACRPVVGSPCYTARMNTMRRNVTRLVAQVDKLQRRATGEVVVVGYWNVFRDGAVGRAKGPTYVTSSNQLTTWANAGLSGIASKARLTYADAYTPFKGTGRNVLDPTHLLAPDGDHPKAAGHTVLAETVMTSLGSLATTL